MIRVAAVTNENRVVDASIAMAAGSSEGTRSHQLATAPTELSVADNAAGDETSLESADGPCSQPTLCRDPARGL